MDDAITIFIADDHPLFRRGVREVIQEIPRYTLVGEAGDGETALQEIRTALPRIALLDVEMPKLSGLEVAQVIHDTGLPVSVILLTVHDEDVIFRKARDSGVMGYILKDSASTDIHLAIEAVVNGDCFISPAVAKHMLKKAKPGNSTDAMIETLGQLTATEKTVLRLIARSKTTADIARELYKSPRTIGNHRLSICQKLNLHGVLTLVRFALENREMIETAI